MTSYIAVAGVIYVVCTLSKYFTLVIIIIIIFRFFHSLVIEFHVCQLVNKVVDLFIVIAADDISYSDLHYITIVNCIMSHQKSNSLFLCHDIQLCLRAKNINFFVSGLGVCHTILLQVTEWSVELQFQVSFGK
jgi:hypothetical protein